jgi:hypothetical protein
MRKPLVVPALLALALPVAGLAALRAGEGVLSVENGNGKLSLQARGGVIGRIDSGKITIYDLTPDDANDPFVFGGDQPVVFIGENGTRHAGTGLRFRLAGGGFRVVINGKGIDLSVVGKGNGSIEGDPIEPGLYSLDGNDCRKAPSSCLPLPGTRKVFQLGSGEKIPARPETP